MLIDSSFISFLQMDHADMMNFSAGIENASPKTFCATNTTTVVTIAIMRSVVSFVFRRKGLTCFPTRNINSKKC